MEDKVLDENCQQNISVKSLTNIVEDDMEVVDEKGRRIDNRLAFIFDVEDLTHNGTNSYIVNKENLSIKENDRQGLNNVGLVNIRAVGHNKIRAFSLGIDKGEKQSKEGCRLLLLKSIIIGPVRLNETFYF